MTRGEPALGRGDGGRSPMPAPPGAPTLGARAGNASAFGRRCIPIRGVAGTPETLRRSLGTPRVRRGDADKGLLRPVLDLQCRFRVKVRPYGNEKGRRFDHWFRVVGALDARTKEYHSSVTNIQADRIPAEHLGEIYRLRREVETFYETAKGGLGMGEMDTTKPHIVRTLVRGALVRATLAMRARCVAERNAPVGRWINPQQWVRIWREDLHQLNATVLYTGRLAVRWTWQHLVVLSLDPNVKRVPTRRRYGGAATSTA